MRDSINMYSKADQMGKKKRKKRGGLTAKTFHAECEDKEIFYCEVCKYEYYENIRSTISEVSGWTHLDPAHRHERKDYVHNLDLLWNFNQVIRCCRAHHLYIDSHKEYREEVFISLRGKCKLVDNVGHKV